jgi:hypothetical protein
MVDSESGRLGEEKVRTRLCLARKCIPASLYGDQLAILNLEEEHTPALAGDSLDNVERSAVRRAATM